jgi:hypothetical protein
VQAVLEFEVLDWSNDGKYVAKIRLFGTNHRGEAIDMAWAFDGLLTIAEVHRTVARMNNGSVRGD